jgi:hypothetical protein
MMPAFVLRSFSTSNIIDSFPRLRLSSSSPSPPHRQPDVLAMVTMLAMPESDLKEVQVTACQQQLKAAKARDDTNAVMQISNR